MQPGISPGFLLNFDSSHDPGSARHGRADARLHVIDHDNTSPSIGHLAQARRVPATLPPKAGVRASRLLIPRSF